MIEMSDNEMNEIRDALREYMDTMGDRLLCQNQVSDSLPPDPERFASVNLHPSAQQAHHLAGYAVAVGLQDGVIEENRLGSAISFSDHQSGTDPTEIRHTTEDIEHPFIWFAAIRASALWSSWCDDTDIDSAMDIAWYDTTTPSKDGIGDRYEARVDELAERFGSTRIERAWEAMWDRQLQRFDLAVCEVAAMLIDGHPVTHEDVQAAVDRCLGV